MKQTNTNHTCFFPIPLKNANKFLCCYLQIPFSKCLHPQCGLKVKYFNKVHIIKIKELTDSHTFGYVEFN